MSLINREVQYKKACDLEAQALAYVGKIANDETRTEEWRIWSAILAERTAFKHDVFDAPEVKPEPKWIPCSERLPEEHIGFYLVTVQKRIITALNVVGCDNTVHDIDIARWDYDRRAPQRGYHWCKADKVIAWMPLPEPFREEGENE